MSMESFPYPRSLSPIARSIKADISASPSGAELENLAAADQRRIHRKERILGGRPDEQNQARLDIGEENILLGAIEAMNFVEK